MKALLTLVLALSLTLPAIAEEHETQTLDQTPEAVETTIPDEPVADQEVILVHDSEAEEVREVIHEVVEELKSEWKNLPDEEKEKLRETLENIGDGFTIDMNHETDFGGVLIAILALLLTVGSPVVIVAIILIYAYRKRKQRDALIAKFVDSGKDVPQEILESFDRSSSPTNNLQRGIMLSGIGIGLILFLGILADWNIAAVGFIPLFIGLARLLIWKLEGNKSESKELAE